MNWQDLANLRANGQKPLLPVIVTTWPERWKPHARELYGTGVLVITHEPGTPIPVRLLEGLRVILALEHCGQSEAVCALLKRRGVKAVVHSWCACYRTFTCIPAKCEDTHDQVAAVEALHAA